MADAGSVMFNFQRQGVIFLEPSVTEDQVERLQARAEDVSHWLPVAVLASRKAV